MIFYAKAHMRYFSKFLGTLSLLFVSLLLPQIALADQTSSLLPSSDGHYLQWTPKSGTTHFTEVDETTCDGQTTFNHTATVGDRDSYGISLSSIPDGATITQLDITPCASRINTGGTNPVMNIFYRLNGVDSSDAGNYSLTGVTPVGLATTTFSGLSTNKSPSTTLETGAVLTSSTKGARLSQIAVKVTYTPLAAPSGLTAVSATPSIILNWTDNSSNENGFKIERSTDGINFVQIATVSANTTSYNNSPLTEGTYYYRVRAYNSGGNSSYSNTTSASIVSAPTNLAASATSSAVNLSWTDTSTTEAGFKIERSSGGSYTQIASVAANTTSYTDTPLTEGTYTYYVFAYNSGGNSNNSNTASASVIPAPTNLTAQATDSATVSLSWIDNATTEAGFKIEIATGAGSFVQIKTVGPNVTSYVDTNRSPNDYHYRVRAFKSTSNSDYSNTADTTVLVAPTGLSASSTNGTDVNLSWTDNSSNEDGFYIERSTDGINFTQIDSVGTDVSTYTDPGLLSGTYYYQVRGYKGSNTSSYTNTANVTLP